MHDCDALRMYTPHYIYRLWLRLSNMTNDRLNKQVFNEASNLAANNGHQNWIVHTIDILKIHIQSTLRHLHYRMIRDYSTI